MDNQPKNSNITCWSKLTTEIFRSILEALDWRTYDSKTIRLVCKEWRALHDMLISSLEPVAFPSRGCVGDLFPNLRNLCIKRFDRWNYIINYKRIKVPHFDPRILPMEEYLEVNESMFAAMLGGATHLTSLTIQGSGINLSVKKYAGLSRLTALTSLHVEMIFFTVPLATTLSKLRDFKSLSIVRCTKTTDQALASLSKLTNLTFLDLSWTDKLAIKGAKAVSSLTRLTHLDLTGCDRMTDECFAMLTSLTNLTSLRMTSTIERGMKITDVGFQAICTLPRLAKLDMSGCRHITACSYKYLRSCTTLTSLRSHFWSHDGVTRFFDDGLNYDGQDSVAAFQEIVSMVGLKELELNRDSGDSEGYESMASLSSLVSVNLKKSMFTDAAMAALSNATGLTELTFGCDLVTNEAVTYLGSFDRLTKLDMKLGHRYSPDSTFDSLSKLTALQSLHIQYVSYNKHPVDALLSIVSHCSQLTSLDIGDCILSDVGLAQLHTLVKLQCLNVSRTAITDQGLLTLTSLTSLKSLNLYACVHITNIGLGCLSSLTNLEDLTIEGCTVSDEGIKALSLLKGLRRLFIKKPDPYKIRKDPADVSANQITLEGIKFVDEQMPWVTCMETSWSQYYYDNFLEAL